MRIIVKAPRDVADSLLLDGLAVRPLARRAEPATVGIVIEALSAAANLVTIAVAVPQVRELILRTVRWVARRPGNEEPASSTVIVRLLSDPPRTIVIKGENDMEIDRVVKAIHEDGSQAISTDGRK